MELNDIPLLVESVDISRYRAAERKIRHVFRGASTELVAMVINFAHSGELGVPSAHDRRRWDWRSAALNYGMKGHWEFLKQPQVAKYTIYTKRGGRK